MQTISIIIPCYNEELAIAKTITELLGSIDSHTDLIVINDCSTDDTLKILNKFKNIRLINHYKNLGYGAAIKTGIRASLSKDYVIWVDSDGQHTTSDVLKLIEFARSNPEVDMIVGSRDQNSAVQHNRALGKFILSKIANYIAAYKIPDLNSGLRIMKTHVIKDYLYLLPNSFSASTTSTLLFLKLNKHILWIPITTASRLGASSVRQIKHGSYTLLLILRIVMLFNPLKIFAPLGFFLAALGITWGIYYYNFDSVSILSTFLISIGFMIFLIGLVADQIVLLTFKER